MARERRPRHPYRPAATQRREHGALGPRGAEHPAGRPRGGRLGRRRRRRVLACLGLVRARDRPRDPRARLRRPPPPARPREGGCSSTPRSPVSSARSSSWSGHSRASGRSGRHGRCSASRWRSGRTRSWCTASACPRRASASSSSASTSSPGPVAAPSTSRRRSCGASSATSTTAPRRGSSRSACSWAAPRSAWTTVPRWPTWCAAPARRRAPRSASCATSPGASPRRSWPIAA